MKHADHNSGLSYKLLCYHVGRQTFCLGYNCWLFCNPAYYTYPAVPRPNEWTTCGEREWRMFQENMTWWNATRICQSYGGHLAHLGDDNSRSTCVKRALQTCFRDGRQISMAYVNSKTNISGSPNCSTYMENEQSAFVNCSEEYPFICERPIISKRY